jgi:hypothetical protein
MLRVPLITLIIQNILAPTLRINWIGNVDLETCSGPVAAVGGGYSSNSDRRFVVAVALALWVAVVYLWGKRWIIYTFRWRVPYMVTSLSSIR